MPKSQLYETEVVKVEPIAVDEKSAGLILGGVSERTLCRFRAQEGLPFVQMGSRIMYIVESLRAWMRAREQVVVIQPCDSKSAG